MTYLSVIQLCKKRKLLVFFVTSVFLLTSTFLFGIIDVSKTLKRVSLDKGGEPFTGLVTGTEHSGHATDSTIDCETRTSAATRSMLTTKPHKESDYEKEIRQDHLPKNWRRIRRDRVRFPDYAAQKKDRATVEMIHNILDTLNENVTLDDSLIPKNRTIFFVETSGTDFIPRQACAVESAARHHPDYFAQVLTIAKINYSEPSVQCLTNLMNVNIQRMNIQKIFDDSPLQEWFKKGIWRTSRYVPFHLSDALRFTLLWKYGGIFLDTDVVVVREFANLTNFVGLEKEVIVCGVIGFTEKHPVIERCVQEVRDHFKGWSWNENGPMLLVRSFKSVCEVSQFNQTLGNKCKGVKILQPYAFYPVHYLQWEELFKAPKSQQSAQDIANKWKNSYLVHMWNFFSAKTKVILNSGSPYDALAKEHCPCVHNSRIKDGFI